MFNWYDSSVEEKIEYIYYILIGIGSALSPDYSYSLNQQDYLDQEREKAEMSRVYEPNPADTTKFVNCEYFDICIFDVIVAWY